MFVTPRAATGIRIETPPLTNLLSADSRAARRIGREPVILLG
jgi:hypothetical protein